MTVTALRSTDAPSGNGPVQMSARILVAVALALIASGCSKSSPLAPTTPAPAAETVITIQYAINIPNRITFQELLTQYPDGRLMAPVTAQQAYDYTAVYHMANVYYGPLAPETSAYGMAGIVVAPVSVASQDSFLASEWPNEYGQFAKARVQWLGRFAYTIANCQTTASSSGCNR